MSRLNWHGAELLADTEEHVDGYETDGDWAMAFEGLKQYMADEDVARRHLNAGEIHPTGMYLAICDDYINSGAPLGKQLGRYTSRKEQDCRITKVKLGTWHPGYKTAYISWCAEQERGREERYMQL